MSLSKKDIEILSRPFDGATLGFKVQAVKNDRALIVPYLQHTDVYARLEEVDPAWSCKSLKMTKTFVHPKFGQPFEAYFCRMEITLLGSSRENVGEGDDPKSAYSDALKRCAVLFGVGRYLYDSNPVWVPYNESQDKYRIWTHADYQAHDRGKDKLPIEKSSPGGDEEKEVDLTPTSRTESPPFSSEKPKMLGTFFPNGGMVPLSKDLRDCPVESSWPDIKLLLAIAIKKASAINGLTEDEILGDLLNSRNAKMHHIAEANKPEQMKKLAKALEECEMCLKTERGKK